MLGVGFIAQISIQDVLVAALGEFWKKEPFLLLLNFQRNSRKWMFGGILDSGGSGDQKRIEHFIRSQLCEIMVFDVWGMNIIIIIVH